MAIERPTIEQLQALASRLNIRLTPAQAEEYLALMQANFDAYDLIDALPDEIPAVHYPRAAGYRPEGDENQLNAWYYKTEVTGAATGKLAGRTVVLKDNIALAGVPMMNGASTLEGFVPLYDATVATRLLDAGATILGKATCEHFCLSGGSHTSDPAPVHNPLRRGYSAGGSSSGSAALVASGEVDLAMGGDQGGSARIPAAWCGLYGLKPTHGLVPYTGIMPIEATFDHTGPMTRSVKDNALVLEVIAGADGLDPRQYAPKVEAYTEALGKGVRGLKIGIMAEGFQLPNLDARVAEKVRATVPLVAQPLPEPNCSITEYISRAFEMIGNTAPQDITGHPAMTLPCGLVDGLPVGMMLVGRHFAESTLYQAAAAFEASGDWRMF